MCYINRSTKTLDRRQNVFEYGKLRIRSQWRNEMQKNTAAYTDQGFNH